MARETIESVVEFLDREFSNTLSSKQAVAFRGHDQLVDKLMATVYRSKNLLKNEDKLLSELTMQSPDEFLGDSLAFEQLVRASHYGLPTRLLDVTLNPLTALFFATKPKYDGNDNEIESDAELIRFEISRKRVKMFDSDTVSLICNLSKLTIRQKIELSKYSTRLIQGRKNKSKFAKKQLTQFRSLPQIESLVQLVCNEKPYFAKEVTTSSIWNFYLAYPKKATRELSLNPALT